MKLFNLATLLASVGLTACGTLAEPTINLRNAFDPNAVAWAQASGNNSINGNALLRTRGGEVRTCAGYEVVLIPVAEYSSERMAAIYGSGSSGYSDTFKYAFGGGPPPAPSEYVQSTRNVTCDSQGNFTFSKLPDGAFFVTTQVKWDVPTLGAQGGNLMQRVEVKGGDSKHIVMTYQ